MLTNIKIESIGVYLPPGRLTTEELMQRCRHRPRLDLERITGIQERRVAEGEFGVDLAVQAAQRALAMSRYSAGELDLIICTSICKYNRVPEVEFEPASATTIRRAIGAENAQTFDVVNACAGMFNGVLLAQAYIRSGQARSVMVVSGEYNWPLADSATREILTSFDGQMAALTLGDCGAALILDACDDDAHGFRYLEMVTGAKHNHFCYSVPSRRGTGGILVTKARGLQLKGAEHFPFYLKKAVDRSGWSMDQIDFGIAHQVSVRGIKNGIKVVNRFLGTEVPHPYLQNCETYGNTTTTSHFLVMHEHLRDGTLQPGHKLLFVSGASGIVITHATYVLDDLGERLRASLGEA
ncbi:MAG: 3-oxoacyl-[acyl-carrier-protein] synthase III C-terminal domain-containing protein [Pseudomonadota bacterium]